MRAAALRYHHSREDMARARDSFDGASRWRTIAELSQVIAGQRTLASLMRELAERLPPLLNFTYMSLVLYDQQRKAMRLHLWHGGTWKTPADVDPELRGGTTRPADEDYMEIGESFSGWVWQHQRPLVIADLRGDHGFSPRVTNILTGLGVRAFCTLPLTTAHRRLGALNLGNTEADAYDIEDLELPTVIASQIAVAVDNALHTEEIEAERLRLRAVIGNVPGIVWEREGAPDSPSRQIVFVSEHARAMWGYSPDEVAASFWRSIVHPGDRERWQRAQTDSFSSGRPAAQQYRVVTKDGRIRWAETFWSAIVDGAGTPVGARGVTLDVTAPRAAERALLRQEQLVHEGRRSERARIARDLHDGFMAEIVTGWQELDRVARTVLQDGATRPDVERILGRLERAIEHARVAILALNESIADDSELSATLGAVAEELQDVHAVAFTARVTGTAPLMSPGARAEILAVAREALTNAFRHARARTIDLAIGYAADGVRVTVTDDGAGIPDPVLRSGRDAHLGLTTMRERAERLGAQLSIETAPSRGTVVALAVPPSALGGAP